MGFFERLRRGIKKIKTKLIVFAILVLVIIVMLVAPLTVSIQDAENLAGIVWAQDPFNGEFWSTLITKLSTALMDPLGSLKNCFTQQYFLKFLGALKIVAVVSAFFALIGISKAIPKHEYEDIENGSSDWCENGEQYKVLSKNKGIVLAEKNFLPVDKRGNVNVLVVRRFWCW